MLKGILTVGGWTMASRVLGFARDMLIAARLGAGPLALGGHQQRRGRQLGTEMVVHGPAHDLALAVLHVKPLLCRPVVRLLIHPTFPA